VLNIEYPTIGSWEKNLNSHVKIKTNVKFEVIEEILNNPIQSDLNLAYSLPVGIFF